MHAYKTHFLLKKCEKLEQQHERSRYTLYALRRILVYSRISSCVLYWKWVSTRICVCTMYIHAMHQRQCLWYAPAPLPTHPWFIFKIGSDTTARAKIRNDSSSSEQQVWRKLNIPCYMRLIEEFLSNTLKHIGMKEVLKGYGLLSSFDNNSNTEVSGV